MLSITSLHRVRVAALAAITALATLLALASGLVATADAATYSVSVSTQPDRSSSQSLAGRSFAGSATIYVFATPASGVRRVHFYVDDPQRTRAARSIDSSAPFDFNGTSSTGSAIGFSLSALTAGSHTITAAVERNSGSVQTTSGTFTVMSTTTTPPPPPPPPPVADTINPVSAVLSAISAVGQVNLSWTAATDNAGVTRYEVWRDSSYVAGLGSSARSYAVTGLTAGVSHSFRVVAYDAAGNYANSNIVSVAAGESSVAPPPPPPPPPPTGTPAPFPSRLTASGRKLVDENGYVMPVLRGFNMHVGPGFTWDQSHFDAIAARGGKITRAVLHWDQYEPTRGVVSAQGIANLDLHIARGRAAGMYTLLELHLNVGRSPSWTADKGPEMERYAAYGQTLTQYLANRYGNPASPYYTKAVVGFGLNEPPLEDSTTRNGNSSIPYLEGKQRQMISWMRVSGGASSWIGFVAYGYASATPIYDDSWQNSNAVDASPTAYDSVGGNVVIDVHFYMVGCTNTNPNCDGRQWNGMSWPTYQGGPQIGVGGSYTSSALYRSQQAANLRPYKTFSTQAGIPLMLGEWGYPTGSGEQAWMNDFMPTLADAGTVIEIQWNYDVSSSNTEWAARPGGVWRPAVAAWMPAV